MCDTRRPTELYLADVDDQAFWLRSEVGGLCVGSWGMVILIHYCYVLLATVGWQAG
ncbi:hypothetical protein BDV36DRAFT_259798 [Aspergillus pseudocaelatus]|uniref:Uncharacterized protein n=1 Tax=Aspergillus pseudocaelatus TaxID=1825620 RepID=A0ABQ6WHC9_9EURO|nr:hypothetical protein BDV36DRAFT_259798 [Aspergillus pseudocaelatus]